MLTPEQLKGKVRNVAKEKGLSSQEILQMYFFERVMERLSVSRYKNNFILKGGFLISSMVGIDERTTMDIDTTVKGIPMEKNEIETIIKEILTVDIQDGIVFIFDRITPIREDDDYNNFRVFFTAQYGKINNPMKMDITTGDEITPAAVDYRYPMILEDGFIDLKAYNLETILAEKYETIIRRNIGNTRARDFYDLFVLYSIYKDTINIGLLQEAVRRTSKKRGSEDVLAEWRDIIQEISEENELLNLWSLYQDEYSYAKKISFEEIIVRLTEIGSDINS